jgi:hypothetical protein
MDTTNTYTTNPKTLAAMAARSHAMDMTPTQRARHTCTTHRLATTALRRGLFQQSSRWKSGRQGKSVTVASGFVFTILVAQYFCNDGVRVLILA